MHLGDFKHPDSSQRVTSSGKDRLCSFTLSVVSRTADIFGQSIWRVALKPMKWRRLCAAHAASGCSPERCCLTATVQEHIRRLGRSQASLSSSVLVTRTLFILRGYRQIES